MIKKKVAYRYKVDIFDKDSTSDLAVKIIESASLGFEKTDYQDVPDPSHLRHKLMRFEESLT